MASRLRTTLPQRVHGKDHNMANDTHFLAEGAAPAGFETTGGDITDGVNVQGKRSGVYAEALLNSQTGRVPPDPVRVGKRVGICGVGDHYGVVGEAHHTAGVYGQTRLSGAGVIGVGQDQQVGLAGISALGSHAVAGGARGVGVLGATESGAGAGVVGISLDTVDPPNPRDWTGPATGTGVGVLGKSARQECARRWGSWSKWSRRRSSRAECRGSRRFL